MSLDHADKVTAVACNAGRLGPELASRMQLMLMLLAVGAMNL